MYKIGAVGDKDSILAFKSIGIEVHPVTDEKEARTTVDRLAEENYGLIFVTEHVAQNIEDTIERYKKKLIPAIILIPSNQGTLGMGMDDINKNVEKAVGSNIFANSDK
ncbi:V-type ATP synthase subunit F [Peptostreptococcus canis]|uniref:V-type ATP synthase subunit F n=1 Tax=Peptostreptococcus canis TaxID=1159213 RepID=A0ABR6TMX0_9FIRM|nr:V-type ATP synthase subunit F [Peptostreptococcus canis]MBC2576766.1 V-type ATP synthase subunit F [Peptostreptococcus canis]MBP1998866.1 V/A-type H+-transporting ATPase subunit F [Peptostreptococcus canis]